MKKCACCGVEKSPFEFTIHRQKADGLNSYCKPCKKIKDKESYLRHAEKRYESSVAWKAANQDKVKSYKRTWNRKNEEYFKDWHQENPDAKKKHAARYKRQNRDLVLADTRERQCRKMNATPAWANKEAIKSKYRLARFFTDLSGGFVKYHVDHVVPLRGELVCGLHVETNLQVLPAYANLAKSNQHT